MKTSNLYLLNFILSMTWLQASSQINDSRITQKGTINVVEIDPRQYVLISYNRYRTREKLDTIWSWESRKNVPNQKYNALDIAGQVKIEFEKTGLIRNTDFFGNVTLEAEISGSKGTRPIEVNPYSEIGIARKAIGIKSDPPYEVSNKLLSMLVEISEVGEKKNLLETAYSFRTREALKQYGITLANVIDACDKKNPNVDSIKDIALDAYDELASTTSLYSYGADSIVDQIRHIFMNSATLKVRLVGLKAYTYTPHIMYIRDPFIKAYLEAAEYLQDKLPLTLEFLKSFEKGGQEGLKAFLSLTSLNLIKYVDIKNTLIKSQDTLSRLHLPTIDSKMMVTDSILLLYKDPIYKAMNALYYLSRLQGSEIERIVIGYTRDKVKNRTPLQDSIYSFNSSIVKNAQQAIALLINTYKDSLAILVARKAGEQIYKKLIKASIDLGKSGAAEGETLSLYLTWILDGSDSLQNSPRLEIGKYQLINSGWGLEVADMFALVNRSHPSRTVDPTHTSPSVFKGTGGAVLMWTYSKEDKGLNVNENKNGYYTRRKNVFMNFLQPSFGINVSYLDFNTSKDVEIGTGLQLGLFHNKVYFGYGVNLNLLSPKDAPFYFFLGFSFAKLSDLFKDAGKVSSSN